MKNENDWRPPEKMIDYYKNLCRVYSRQNGELRAEIKVMRAEVARLVLEIKRMQEKPPE